MFILLSICVAVIVLCTLIPLSRNAKWWVRFFDFPRLQFSIFCIVLLAAELFWLDLLNLSSWILLLTTLGCFIYQAWWIFPYTKLAKPEVKSSSSTTRSTISIVTANVLMTNRNARKLIDLVRRYNPHIVVTLETNDWWQSHLDKLEDTYQHTIKCPLDNLYGMHVYSRLPLENTKIQYLVEDDIPSMHAQAVLNNGDKIRVHFLHPAPPSPTENEESTERDAELVMVAKNIEKTCDSHQPVIITGDMNDVAWSRTTRLFRKISGLLDPRIGRGIFNTFHAKYWFMRWPLDHLFHSEHFTLDKITRLPAYGSDHFALYTQLSLEPKQAPHQSGVDKEDGDEQIAEAIMSEKANSSRNVYNPT
ncbi:endonuclease [Kangiella sp. HD9-110m-PIT-SAG06]|nr:endonuclease [Kangiella sp. HD9-110m-PIT-SAG06]